MICFVSGKRDMLLNLTGKYDLVPSHPSVYTCYSHTGLKVDRIVEDTVKGKMRKMKMRKRGGERD
jgi:hypothetical protein